MTRLTAAGLSALGVGLGPSLSAIPAALLAACQKHGLCLLVVPPATPFLKVTKAYWTARSRSAQQALSDAITAHQSLVNAMVTADPVGETLKALSRAIGAWVARLDPEGEVEHVFPSARVADATAIAEQISSLRVAGTHASATFPSGDEVVAVFPLPLEDRIVGYIAVGSAGPLRATARRLVLTAGALLSLNSIDRQRADADLQLQTQAVSALLDMGFLEPARRLASRVGAPPVPDLVRLLVVRSPQVGDVTDVVRAWMPQAIVGPPEGGLTWFILPHLSDDLGHLTTSLLRVDRNTTGVLSDAVAVSMIHPVRLGLTARLSTIGPGVLESPAARDAPAERLLQGLHAVLHYSRTDLAATLVAYLRHRGQWDPAARDLGVHRNTVRHRMVTIRELLAADPDNPDVAAELWLYLRKNGLA